MPQHYKELVALHSYTAELSVALSEDPSERWFSDMLIAKDLISKRVVENILTRNDCAYDKFSRIFSTLCKTIATASSQTRASEIFNELVAILRDELKFKDLADQLESKCEESKDTPYSSSSSLNADNALKRSNSDSNVSTDSGALSNDSDLDSVNVLCKCPCGNTDFKHCIQTPPDCLDKGFAEMHLSIGEDTKKAQNYMEHQLALQTKLLKDEEFVHFGMAVYPFAMSIPNGERILKKILLLKKKEIISSSFDELYDQIIEDADFINYEPIKVILKACISVCLANGHAKTELQLAAEVALEKYEEAFQKYAQHRVYAIASHIPELSTTSTKDIHTQLKIKVEEEFKKFPIERIKYFQHCIEKILRLPEETQMRVILVRKGCVELTFQLIGLAGDLPFQLNINQKRELASRRISMLEYAGEVEYCCCELFEDEIGKGVVSEMYEEVCQRNFQCDDMDDNQEDDTTNSDGYFEAMAANNPGPELDAFNKLKLHTSKNVGSEDQKKFCDRSVSPFRHEPDEIASPVPLIGTGMESEMHEEVCQKNLQYDDMDDTQEDDTTHSNSYLQESRSRVIALEHLKERTGVTDEQLDKEVDDVHLDDISEHIVDYRKYGPRLGLSQPDIATIERNPALMHSIKLITAAVFKEWHRKNIYLATYRVLVNVALKLEDGTGAEKICEVCTSS